MPTPILKKIKYSDDLNAIIDSLNKNFSSLEFLLSGGKLDGVNINSKYVGKVAAETIETMSLTVGENVDIGEATKTFVTQLAGEAPTPPYHTGDNWVNVFDGNLYTCLFSRESGEFNIADWIYSSQYVQPSGVTTIVNGVVTTDFVNALGITANSVKSNWVYAGNISAGQIDSGTISGVTIDVDTNLTVGANIYLLLGQSARSRILFGSKSYSSSQGVIESDPVNGNMVVGFPNVSGGSYISFTPGGNAFLQGNLDVDNNFSTYRVDSSLIPRSTETYSLGSSTRRWDYLYANAVNTSGNVGIGGGLINKNAYLTDETGRTVIVDSAGNFGSESSTIRKKENVKPHKFNSEGVLNLDIVSFNLKKEYCREQVTKYGVIAEQALEVGLHELVGYDDKGNVDYFAYEKLSLACLQLIQEQDKKIKELERKIEILEKGVVE